jgi:type VI protein secretion system component VasK
MSEKEEQIDAPFTSILEWRTAAESARNLYYFLMAGDQLKALNKDLKQHITSPELEALNATDEEIHQLEVECAVMAARISDRIADIQKLRVENDQLSDELRRVVANLGAA